MWIQIKSGSIEFKCGFIRGLFGLGRGMRSTKYFHTGIHIIIYYKENSEWGLVSKWKNNQRVEEAAANKGKSSMKRLNINVKY